MGTKINNNVTSDPKTEETKVEETKTEETTKKAGKKYRALVSFCGQITMSKGSEREINNKELAKDLLKAGYIEEVK